MFNSRRWDPRHAQGAGIWEDFLGALSNPNPRHWAGAGDVQRLGGKFTWSKETADSQLSEGAVFVKIFRHTKFMFARSCEDHGPED